MIACAIEMVFAMPMQKKVKKHLQFIFDCVRIRFVRKKFNNEWRQNNER